MKIRSAIALAKVDLRYEHKQGIIEVKSFQDKAILALLEQYMENEGVQ
jgi:hypothetical protein